MNTRIRHHREIFVIVDVLVIVARPPGLCIINMSDLMSDICLSFVGSGGSRLDNEQNIAVLVEKTSFIYSYRTVPLRGYYQGALKVDRW